MWPTAVVGVVHHRHRSGWRKRGGEPRLFVCGLSLGHNRVGLGERRQKCFFVVWKTGRAFSLVGSALVRFAFIWWLIEKIVDSPLEFVDSLLELL